MSGLNVWLKLLKSPSLLPRPFLLSPDAVLTERKSSSSVELEQVAVYQLPYAAALRHTVEEVVDYCENCLSSARHIADTISGNNSRNFKSSSTSRCSFSFTTCSEIYKRFCFFSSLSR